MITMEKALILAAGVGSRLAPLTDNIPKSLVTINGKPILFKQIENLTANGISDITIISGYKAQILETAVHARWKHIRIINSVDYATTNNMYSAYLAKDVIGKSSFFLMNADVFFDASVITELQNFDFPNAIVTDIGNYMEESMKVVRSGDRIVQISKAITREDALGASIDVYKFSEESGLLFFDKCSEYINKKKELNLWSEVALNDILREVEFRACPLVGRWFEIDNLDDLKAAEKLFDDV
jgi:choline kinase